MDMRVGSTYNTYQIFSANNSGRARRINTEGSGGIDTFTLSVQAEDYKQARNAVSSVPDIRTDKVDSIKSQIEAGKYFISASQVADRILQNAVI